MKTKKIIKQQWHKAISRATGIFIELFLGVRAGVEERNRRRLRLLSAFLLLMTLVIFSGAFTLIIINNNAAYVMLGTSGLLFISYFISRTRFAPVAIWLAIILPAIPPSAVVFFKPEGINLAAELMWLALPLLVASLMMSLKKAIIVAASYIAYVILLAFVGSFGVETFAPLIAYLVVIGFFVITITDVRSKDHSEIEHQLQERRQTEKALRESELKFNTAFHASPVAICIGRVKDWHLIEVNDSFLRMTGFTHDELIDHQVDTVGFSISAAEIQKIVSRLMTIKKIYNEEFSFTNKRGEIRKCLVSVEVIDINGETCVLLVATDITERQQAENKLRQAMSDLEHSTAQLKATNKELESFSYSVSHDLRSPLRSINGFSQALLEDYATKLDDTGKNYLNRVRNASQKMGELIDGLLRLSRLTRSEMHGEKVDLSVLAKDIIDRLKETNPKRQVKFVLGDDLLTNGDPQMIRVLLENLLGNAWNFTAKTRNAEIELGKQVNGNQKTFFIRDNGAGFDMAFKDRLFGAFQRLHDVTEFPGTGIGLATVQRIINRHGGTISAEGKLGKGATFYFNLDGEV
jgi:PAS domain S-box-containing protein